MKTIWIFNHYATLQYLDQGGRHYCFAKYLQRKGYNIVIFCANTIHNSNTTIDTHGDDSWVETVDGVSYVFIKTPSYYGNGKKRIINMCTFYKKLFGTARKMTRQNGKPDIVLASSAHLLTLIAGIKIGKKMKTPCICEVRDMWPESFVAYGIIPKKNPATHIMYKIEKWIYEHADSVIFTMEGGKNYIIDKKWDKAQGGNIDLNNVYHINNGVDLEVFNYNRDNYIINDDDLDNVNTFKAIYVGSIRKANNIDFLVDVAKELRNEKIEDVRIIIYGDGTEHDRLEKKVNQLQLNNIVFKGSIDKKLIPNVLKKADVNLLIGVDKIPQYGVSMNKLFDYIASNKPIIYSSNVAHCLIRRHDLGIAHNFDNAVEFVDAILKIKRYDSARIEKIRINAQYASKLYDYKALTESLTEIIERNVKKNENLSCNKCSQ